MENNHNWCMCLHKFKQYFGPILKCDYCGATTTYSVDEKPKTIFAPLLEK